MPAILGSSNGKKHRIALDREARLQAFQGVRQKRADQIPRAISKNVSRIHSQPRQILGTRRQGTHLAQDMEEGTRLDSTICEMVCRRSTRSLGEQHGSSSYRSVLQ